jgi:methyl-accepting chemotaxis protein
VAESAIDCHTPSSVNVTESVSAMQFVVATNTSGRSPEPVATVVQSVNNSEDSRIDSIVSPEPGIDVSDIQNPELDEVELKNFSQTQVTTEISNLPVSGQTGEVQPKPFVDIVLMQLNFRKIEEAVDDINERISLMAFNALLEAARAGEAGKGFQVIAEELRRLADRSSKSAGEVKKLFAEISNKLSNANPT